MCGMILLLLRHYFKNHFTFQVIPFSQQSGIAEWCSNTISLGDYLVGKHLNPGAHQKYRPNDMLPLKARNIIKVRINYYCVHLLLLNTYFYNNN